MPFLHMNAVTLPLARPDLMVKLNVPKLSQGSIEGAGSHCLCLTLF